MAGRDVPFCFSSFTSTLPSQRAGYVGRVRRDLRRHLQEIPQGLLRGRVLNALWLLGRLLEQGPKSQNKPYSLHEPEVDCISEGKARVRYEFRTKVTRTRHSHR